VSIKLVKYDCTRLEKTITVTETYVDFPGGGRSLTRVSCNDVVNCIGSDCKMVAESNPTLYINAKY